MLTTDGRGSPEYAQALHFNPMLVRLATLHPELDSTCPLDLLQQTCQFL
jgi:hypothetical protein